MYTTCSETEVQQKVTAALAEDSATPVSTMSEQLGLSEGAITLALPEEMMTRIDGKHAQTILEQLPEWGSVTTIVHSFGSIFETKANFPKGKEAHGYYNLMGRDGELHGHLRLDLVEHIAFVSKPFRGMESHYIGFFNANGDCVFKVYVGRDKKRQLFPEQVEAFMQMKKEFAA
ncbi:heme utilization cystosolic carrier protein HutX [Vibrio ziniensis]|uniref:Heme utilization cystosolic carrier protein HutX n=1 Tax=Vibrio ziniensis TaxID=2711221 RepID=A0A6G7CKY7_9VIBR|nr:heme utilization cystosolic carrier protein HutX [Vibrio ziniensis]QIH42744.1 heme utilization cystosolic carrier protein HutX [Vibrio ziniensis]